MFAVKTNFIVNGKYLNIGDKAYNKNKREQVENPHIVAMFIEDPIDGVFVVLQPPNVQEYITEDASCIEKYPGDKNYEESCSCL